MTRNENAAFYVANNDDTEIVKETTNFNIIRKGRLLLKDSKTGKVYSSTQDLLDAGINDNENSENYIHSLGLRHNELPRFEVTPKDTYSTPSFEHYIFDDLKDAEDYAQQLEESVNNRTNAIARLSSWSDEEWDKILRAVDGVVATF